MNEKDNIKQENTESLPAADVKVESGKDNLTVFQNYEVKQEKSKVNDALIMVNESTLKKCIQKLEIIKDQKVTSLEILLGLATASLGGSLGALASSVKFEAKFLGIFFYLILPIIFVGFSVAYYYKRKENFNEPNKLASDILEELPDPDDTVSLNKNNIE